MAQLYMMDGENREALCVGTTCEAAEANTASLLELQVRCLALCERLTTTLLAHGRSGRWKAKGENTFRTWTRARLTGHSLESSLTPCKSNMYS